MADNKKIYPHLVIKNNENPNKLYAFPLLGVLIKLILLIPVFIMAWALSIVYFILWCITPFIILFTGNYWQTAYNFNLSFFKYYTKITLFLYGLTDKYPGFTLNDDGIFELHIDKPTSPNRWLALPLIGLIIRSILLIPYFVYKSVLQYGAYVAVVASWFAVLIKGKYPEALYEFERDGIRVSLSMLTYVTYMSDTYPSFSISMKHKTTKILLIIAGSLLFLSDITNNFSGKSHDMHNEYMEPKEEDDRNKDMDYEHFPES